MWRATQQAAIQAARPAAGAALEPPRWRRWRHSTPPLAAPPLAPPSLHRTPHGLRASCPRSTSISSARPPPPAMAALPAPAAAPASETQQASWLRSWGAWGWPPLGHPAALLPPRPRCRCAGAGGLALCHCTVVIVDIAVVACHCLLTAQYPATCGQPARPSHASETRQAHTAVGALQVAPQKALPRVLC